MSGIPTITGTALPSNAPGHQTGWLAQLDPRARILCAVGFAVTVVTCDSFGTLVAAVAIALALLVASRLPPRQTLRRMVAMDSFILFMLILLPFTVPGEPILTIWGISASWEGLAQATRIALKANAVILALMALVGTMEPVVLGHALHSLRVPAGLVHLLMFTVRYIEVLRQEYMRLRLAMKARGFRPSTCWHTYRSVGYLLGMMLVRSVERSERIMDAMKCRGFTGHIPLMKRFCLSQNDIVFAALFSLLIVTLLVGEALHAAV
ncbi:cobalt ECF transporter T component CbiQ [Tropicimonas marinistellae]|uniref:cobalt ECF transporter T component CbiQ n=1 Tax=Tropicimonas marinistellae TaxID=1739787 RepID=UPI00082E241D|nr:cobalt ECF transporter T component CbiQ [Tropicimonas marinistellae]